MVLWSHMQLTLIRGYREIIMKIGLVSSWTLTRVEWSLLFLLCMMVMVGLDAVIFWETIFINTLLIIKAFPVILKRQLFREFIGLKPNLLNLWRRSFWKLNSLIEVDLAPSLQWLLETNVIQLTLEIRGHFLVKIMGKLFLT